MNAEIDPQKDVIGVGNAIVDILARADESLLAQLGLSKGAMTLVDSNQAAKIYASMENTIEMSGGSVANTMVGLASLGGTGSYIGKVSDDELGTLFQHDLDKMGISMHGDRVKGGPPTAKCLVIVTPDGQRSLATYLGACVNLAPGDINLTAIEHHRITYLEGYLWDLPLAKEAMLSAAKQAHLAGRSAALTLSDSFCVSRHRDSFLDLIRSQIDILFANEEEIISLYEASDLESALQLASQDCDLAAITLGQNGSVIITKTARYSIPAEPVSEVVDTTGAGDLYAAGFLFGVTHGYDIPTCGRIASIAAAEIIGHMGARPEKGLSALLSQTL